MNSSQASILRRALPISIFEELCSLWRQLVEIEGSTAILLSNEIISSEISQRETNSLRGTFYLLLSSQLNALLQATLNSTSLSYQVTITWEPQAITDFIHQLQQHLSNASPWRDRLTPFLKPQSVESTPLQTYFMTRLFDILVPQFSEDGEVWCGVPAVCKPVEDALRQQIAQERLLYQLIGQIRQSLELSVILETAVRELRSFLQVDRLVIYEFGSKNFPQVNQSKLSKTLGRVTYESRVSKSIPSLLNVVAEDNCFGRIPHYQQKYSQGSIVAVEDVERTYSSSLCLIQFLEKYWILSKLIAPIILEGNLWGLLIAHQCFKKREWSESEKNFLGQIGEHLAVAIYQAQLYAQVQEQKKTFEQRVIERTQELRDTLIASQAANHSKSEFLGNMSHELRTPLTCVIGLSGTLLHWSGESSSLPLEKQRQYLQTIQDSGKHLLEIINEILEYSQLQAGKYVLAVRDFSLSYVARSVLKRLSDEAENRQINLQLDLRINPEEDRFFADPERTQQILYHLLNNALKFTPEEGTVILRVWRENNQVIFQIEDTGIGIKTEQIPLLFESFQQLEHSRRRTYGGTGLGLALTKQLVELHGGTIEVESILKEGSIFTVRLPNQPQRQHKILANLEDEEGLLSRNRTIVLVESNEELATLIGELLTAANYQFIWLIDSANAIKKIELLQPSAIILDQDLEDALKISKDLKKIPETQWIKVLLLSHQLSSQEWTEISQIGIDDYLIKPIQPNLLLKRVNTLMGGDRPVLKNGTI
ncbi:ATP-binding protein [Crocosphaera sp. UHCC 0190]|uniref:hybrid sensor histidine kinase/response regulator n=1 Tax=Crocosphaera sp. UHCC 0190 TaxID=3110246 RepID=UPI002B1F878A|nr:ATP-binding protein [Crocosphaera sp. UHCC 0190]MEA5510823.1 ATP-binding protein [Crocosphaera sp. UHCC 0190]